MTEAFLYTVKPKKAIVGLSGTKAAIRNPKSLLLTKEDVLLCLKSATVYRRFANEDIIERVTIADVDRVHRDKYISPEEWPTFVAEEKSTGHAEVVAPKKEEVKPAAPAKEEKKEDKKAKPVVAEVAAPVETAEEVVEEVVESDDDEVVEKVEVPETAEEE